MHEPGIRMLMKWLAHPSLAVLFGAFMLCEETCDHFEAITRGDWRNMPIHDWTAAGLLIGVGVSRVRFERRDYQAVAWAFMLSLLVGAFFGHLGEWGTPSEPDDWISERVVLTALVVLIGIASGALLSTLRAARKSH